MNVWYNEIQKWLGDFFSRICLLSFALWTLGSVMNTRSLFISIWHWTPHWPGNRCTSSIAPAVVHVLRMQNWRPKFFNLLLFTLKMSSELKSINVHGFLRILKGSVKLAYSSLPPASLCSSCSYHCRPCYSHSPFHWPKLNAPVEFYSFWPKQNFATLCGLTN